MDIQQLKQLAGRVRAWLAETSQSSLGHSESLDLVAALPGLRNWPEVMAFPDRVQRCRLDSMATSRLAYRLRKKFGIEVSHRTLLEALLPPSSSMQLVPEIWPAGPVPGVYLTTSQSAIDNLLANYDDATDGALLYAERAGSGWKGAIDLGDGGLWSNGLDRVPSGTLIVVGPVELDQQSWEDASYRLEMACIDAITAGHRVAVLIDTPSPETMCPDAMLLVRERSEPGDDLESAVVGIVTDEGDLKKINVDAPYSMPVSTPFPTPTRALPEILVPHLAVALSKRNTGLLAFGSPASMDNPGSELVEAALALTEQLGPAARIMPRHRGTPAKWWNVPEGIKRLPFLPSVQAAYSQGYRRLVIDPNYIQGEVLQHYQDEILFLAGCYAGDVEGVTLTAGRPFLALDRHDRSHLGANLIAAVAVTPIPVSDQEILISDMYVAAEVDPKLLEKVKSDDILDFIFERRVVRFEEQLGPLVDSGTVDITEVDHADLRRRGAKRLLEKLKEKTFGAEGGGPGASQQ